MKNEIKKKIFSNKSVQVQNNNAIILLNCSQMSLTLCSLRCCSYLITLNFIIVKIENP